jgi:hypothetical protein
MPHVFIISKMALVLVRITGRRKSGISFRKPHIDK